MIELVFPAQDLERLRIKLATNPNERCAVAFASQTARADSTVRLLVRDLQFPEPTDYTRSGPLDAELTPQFVARTTKRAIRDGAALVFAHSHPGSESPSFSAVDSRGEERLAAFLAHRHPGPLHAALVVGSVGMRARSLAGGKEIRIISLGERRDVLFDPLDTAFTSSEVFDRQVRILGSAAQRALERLRVAVVGLGGTGSIVVQQLTHLGVRDFILIDPDVLEATNLNRVANAGRIDLGHPKVQVAERGVHTFSHDAIVRSIQGDVTSVDVARQILNADIVFGCTDSHGSRAVLQQVSYQYLIPCIDMGLGISRVGDLRIYGRVQLLSPGLPCFTCSNVLDSEEVRRDMMTAFERRADPYIQDAREPAPAVMSLNGCVASLAVTMLLSVVAAFPMIARHLLYDALPPALRPVRFCPQENCYICSRAGALARGDSWPLFARGS